MAALAIIDRHDEFPHKPLLMAFVLLQPDVVVVAVRRRALGRLTDMRPQSGCGELGGGEVSTEVQLVWDWDGNEMDCDWEVCNHSCVIGVRQALNAAHLGHNKAPNPPSTTSTSVPCPFPPLSLCNVVYEQHYILLYPMQPMSQFILSIQTVWMDNGCKSKMDSPFLVV
jgi:hypothetical protein